MATNEKFDDTKCKWENRAMERETEHSCSVGGKVHCYNTLETFFALLNKVEHMQIIWFSISLLSIWKILNIS